MDQDRLRALADQARDVAEAVRRSPGDAAERGATLAVSLLSLTGFLSAKYILPEMYGYVEQEEVAAAVAAGEPVPGESA